ncbi:MAG TPA: hypothetical protein VF039_09475, partial [Longimicrobiales bacterium]
RSEAFRSVARSAARQAHGYLFSETGRAVIVSVPDLEIVLRSALAASPEIARALPDDLQLGLPDHPALRIGLAVMRFGLHMSWLDWLVITLGVLVLLGGLALMHDRRDALVAAGATLIVAGIGLWATHPVGAQIIAMVVDDPRGEGALAGLWSVALGGVNQWGLTYAGIGVVLAAAGSSLLERLDIRELLADARLLLVSPRERPAAKLLRGGVLVALGLCVVFAPRTTLAVLTVVAGVLVTFVGLREVFGVVLHSAPADARFRTAFAESREGWTVGAVLVVLLAAAFATAIVVLHRTGGDDGADRIVVEGREVTSCNGSAALCDKRLDEVTLMGTHNSMSSADAGWMFPNQHVGIAQQLGDGVRALMLDVHYGVPVGDRVRTEIAEGRPHAALEALGPAGVEAAMRIRSRLVSGEVGSRGLWLCHGFCELGALSLDSALVTIRDFLVAHPGEVLILIFEDYVAPADLASAVERAGLDELVYRGDGKPPWPTLREMIESSQRVLVLIESGRSGIDWLLPAFEVMQETPYRFLSADDTLSCAPNRGGTAGSLFLVNHWIETAPAPRPSNAEIVNVREVVDERTRRCTSARGRLVNVLAMDFFRSGTRPPQ